MDPITRLLAKAAALLVFLFCFFDLREDLVDPASVTYRGNPSGLGATSRATSWSWATGRTTAETEIPWADCPACGTHLGACTLVVTADAAILTDVATRIWTADCSIRAYEAVAVAAAAMVATAQETTRAKTAT